MTLTAGNPDVRDLVTRTFAGSIMRPDTKRKPGAAESRTSGQRRQGLADLRFRTIARVSRSVTVRLITDRLDGIAAPAIAKFAIPPRACARFDA
jgi:hypothetical protein